MDASGTTGTGCVENFDYEVTQPFRLTASAAIIEDASCNSAGALVKIINTNGGQAPYEYSFNGGTFSTINESNLLAGDHDLMVKDALGCTFEMDLNVPDGIEDPSFLSDIVYDCDGLGTLTVTPSNTTDFTYSYTLNGTANSPIDSNIFNNVADGTHAVSIAYSNTLAPSQSTLFFESFGAGPTTQIGEIGPGYCYEPQDGSTTNCNLGPAGILVNGEYTVTNFVTNPVILRSPNDHTAIPNGRFLAIDVSTLAGESFVRERIVAMCRTRIATIRVACPYMVSYTVVPVNIIPTGINYHAVVINTGVPLVGLMITQRYDVAAIVFHGIKRIVRTRPTR